VYKRQTHRSAFNQNSAFSLRQVLDEAVSIPPQFQKRTDIMRMTETLTRLGCYQGFREARGRGKARTRKWLPSPDLIIDAAGTKSMQEKIRAWKL
jgi:hypothetical protein